MIQIGKKVLITTQNWFIAPNGRQYKSVFGTVHEIRSDNETLGIRTNARSTNWYLRIGNMTIAGCQIFYAVECKDIARGEIDEFTVHEGITKHYKCPSPTFLADEVSP